MQMPRRSTGVALFLALFAGVAQAQNINLQEGFAPVVERVMPSVVNITIYDARGRAIGGGSGFVVSADGLIVTNVHVVAEASRARVEFHDGKRLWASPVGYDAQTDLSVIKVDGKGLRPVVWGDSTRVRPGEFALALGNPLGLPSSVSLGIVSAVGRRTLGAYAYEDFIQTDAAVNPGNSGGPLVNARGEVIGVNSIIKTPTGGSIGLGFAISSNLARSIVDQLARDGRVVRGFLGVQFEDTDDKNGVLVARVVPRSPAASAGLRLGDVLVAINGKSVYDAYDARLQIAQARPGADVVLAVVRQGARRELRARLVPRPDR